MKTIEQLEQEIARLQREVETLKAAEWPKNGDKFFWVAGRGDVGDEIWCGNSENLKYKAQGNIFRTEEEALRETECRAIVAEYRRQPGRKAFVFGKKNWNARIDEGSVRPCDISLALAGLFQTYFDSKESTEAAISAVGAERLRKAAMWQSQQGVV